MFRKILESQESSLNRSYQDKIAGNHKSDASFHLEVTTFAILFILRRDFMTKVSIRMAKLCSYHCS